MAALQERLSTLSAGIQHEMAGKLQARQALLALQKQQGDAHDAVMKAEEALT